ncbi:MAG: tetratricopeptide repeat protein, partial [Dehalococcoidia bacterium]|nr:tetratricopeptide repeat protein [Dehalococcoidia bacterium]
MRSRFGTVLVICTTLLVLACANPALEHLEQGDTYYEYKQWDEAIIEYNKAIELEPTIELNAKLAQTYANRAEAYNQTEDYDKAFADLDKAI